MIYDNLLNIGFYADLSEDIYSGLSFLKDVESGIAEGIYQINPRVKAIVTQYETKRINEFGYEAHKRFIDIQCVLLSHERVAYLPIDRLKETQAYSVEKDAAFYTNKSNYQPSYFILQPGYFAIFFPQDGHMPQLSVEEPHIVKKIVVKVEIKKDSIE